MEKSQLLGTFEQLVLSAILQVGDGAYPPLVLEWLREHTNRSVNRGSLYVTLDRMEEKGLLRSRAARESRSRGGRPRRHLQVTPAGLEALRDARRQLLGSWAGIEDLLGGEK